MIANPLPVPPQAIQAEQSVLGGCLLDVHAYGKISHLLSAEDFYDRRHKIIFHAIVMLQCGGSAVDVVIVNDFLESKGMSEKAGGLAYLGGLLRDTPGSANIVHYAAIVREKSMLRSIIATAQEMMAAAMAADGSGAGAIISQAENQIFALGQKGLRGQQGFVRMREVLHAVVDEMETHYENPPKDGIRGLASGFDDLDEMTGGSSPGDLVIIAARPSMGKTALAMNIAEHIAMDKGKPVAVFSMEMQKEALAQRCLASVSGAGLRKIRESWLIQDAEWATVSAGISRLATTPIFIDDTPALTISAVRSRVLRLVSELSDEFPDGMGAVVLDYIQLMAADGGSGDNRNAQIEVISRGMKQLAKELGCPVFVLSQLNRNLESRPNKRPVMSDLRDSGSLEQDADMILFLYRDEVYNAESVDKGIAEVIIGKQRNGALGKVRLQFDGPCARFRNLANGSYAAEDY